MQGNSDLPIDSRLVKFCDFGCSNLEGTVQAWCKFLDAIDVRQKSEC
jgi:hypothetical protein